MRRGAGFDELYRFLRGIGVGPVGAILIVTFLVVLVVGAFSVTSLHGEEQVAEMRFYAVVLALLGAATAGNIWLGLRGAPTQKAPEERLSSRTGTSDGASVRLAIDQLAAADALRTLAGLEQLTGSEQLRRVARALLAAPNAWAYGSLDSLPRMPEEKMTALARRMAADAEKRYPPRDASSAGAAYRAEPWVVVVSVAATSPLTIEEPKGDGPDAVATVLRNLVAISDETTIVEIRVSGALPAAQLIAKDPAMRPMRA